MSDYRPPAVPLVAHDPYFSVWSFADALAGDDTRHWTGAPHRLTGLLRIDGALWRFCGRTPPGPAAPAMRQTGLRVRPTRTAYRFEAGGVGLALTFLTPALLDDLDVLARPLTYIQWQTRSLDGDAHRVQLYFEALGELAADNVQEAVTGGRFRVAGLRTLRLGAERQEPLRRFGDNVRIDWGHLYLAARADASGDAALGNCTALREAFAGHGGLPAEDDTEIPFTKLPGWVAAAHCFDATPPAGGSAAGTLMLAYDDRLCVEYLRRQLQPYWRRHGATAADLLRTAATEETALAVRCTAFDRDLEAEAAAAGGPAYAELCALAYRQAIAGHKLAADADGRPLFFSKENSSNGCIGTVDIAYPSAPLFLRYNPELVRAMLEPVLEYAASPHWRFPFAPHDLGVYPLANGQVYGGAETSEADQMPVEECGNMLLLAAMVVRYGGQDDFVHKHWARFTRWADYLAACGEDPANQLCTDDFAGHLAHNVNLAFKAILAVAAYAGLAERLGADGRRYRAAAETMMRAALARADDGGHTRLAYDAPGTWSLKYNLVWDRLLGLDLVPAEVAARETARYRAVAGPYGCPLDARGDDAKLDWQVWAACLGEDEAFFREQAECWRAWMNRGPSRVPLTDWFDVRTGATRGFRARSVVGGLFLKLLYRRAAARFSPPGERR